MAPFFDRNNSLHSAMWALFLVAFFSFLRKSNLVVDNGSVILLKVSRCFDFTVSSTGAWLNIRATKTIQFFQRALSIPLLIIPHSPLCPVSALNNHLRINDVSPAGPLFSVRSTSTSPAHPLTYSHFSKFLAKVITALGLDSRHYSPHSFRCGGATFAFSSKVSAELIISSSVHYFVCAKNTKYCK